MSKGDDDYYVTFSAPKVAPRVYIVKGPSGWNETFQRTKLDAELKQFLAPLQIEEACSLFVDMRELSDDKNAIDWFTITGWLGRTMQMSPRNVPHTVAIAFWARVIIAKEAEGAN